MINVTITPKGEKLSLRLEGHAGYARRGKDIVCASASILAYTVAQFVAVAEHNGDLKSPPTIIMESGDTLISCEPTEDALSGLENVFVFANMGYQLLHNKYSQYVRLMP
jgi:uncharacterized protein YsxB (DUF464 family)